jgi:hypothetical protein
MRKGVTQIAIDCPVPGCEHGPIELRVGWIDDPGVRYTKNGDGWPPSFEWEVIEPVNECPGGHPVTDDYINDELDKRVDEIGRDDEPEIMERPEIVEGEE